MALQCLLCLESPTIPGCRFLNIFSEEGLNLDIPNIINKYFWIKTTKNNGENEQVCLNCWKVVEEFHLLYQRVEQAHNHLSNSFAVEDPLPLDVLLKSEESPGYDNDDCKAIDNVNVFDAEFKFEVNKLVILPQLEIIEESATDDNAGDSKRSQRVKRRSKQTETIPKISIKRIKKETTQVEEPYDISSSCLDLSLNAEESSANNSQTTKRGRPRRKNKKEDSYNQPSKEDSLENSDVCPKQIETVVIKTEEETNEERLHPTSTEEQDCANDDEYEDDDKEFEVSDDSSGNNSNSDETDVSDWFDEKKTSDKYAVIYKRKRSVPKKYKRHKKGDKPEVKHFTKQELADMRAQQKEHDQIIKEFFKIIRCPKCDVLVKSYSDLRPHFRIDHNKEYGYLVCCGRQFTSRKYLVDHIMVHQNPEQFKCKTCDQICRDSKSLEVHEQSHLTDAPPVIKEPVQCEICLKTYTSKSGLKHHKLSAHLPKEEYEFECSECQKKCPTRKDLQNHIKRIHEKVYSVICDKCGKYFSNTYALKKHDSLEHDENPKETPIPQQCTICGTWLSHSKGLRLHMKNIHESVGTENKCHICGFLSSTPRALKKHIYHRHECLPKFQCTMCEKAFKRPNDLKEHISVHTRQDLYACPNCPMTFRSYANMHKHRQRLHRAEWEAERKETFRPNIMKLSQEACL